MTAPAPLFRALPLFVALGIGAAIGWSLRAPPSSASPREPSRRSAATPPGARAAQPPSAGVASADVVQGSGASRKNYTLHADRPHLAARFEEHVNRSVAVERQKSDPRYAELFSALGVSDADSQHLREFILAVHRAKVQAAQFATQLAYAQADFDREAEAVLGESAYRQFVAYESHHLARREMELFKEFAGTRGISLPPDDERIVESLVARYEAYSAPTSGSYGGPFDPTPAAFGGKAFVPRTLALKEGLVKNASAVLQGARTEPLPPETVSVLEEYYATQIAGFDHMVEMASSAQTRVPPAGLPVGIGPRPIPPQ